MRGEVLIIDKSALQCLARTESRWLGFRYFMNLPPILALEVLADLKKSDGILREEQLVQKLAAKFGGSGGVVNVEYRETCLAALVGAPVPMTGQAAIDYGHKVRDPDGGYGMIVDLAPINHAIMRWRNGRFTSEEHKFAERWRAATRGFSLRNFEQFLRGRGVPAPRPRDDAELSQIVDAMLDDQRFQEPWLTFLLDELRTPSHLRLRIRRRWSDMNANSLKSFAPYSHFCVRALLHVLVLWKHRLTKLEPNNLLDAQYLYYLPFCQVFASRDSLHRRVAPLLMRPDQRFLWGDDLKAEMKAEDLRIQEQNAAAKTEDA